MTAPSQNITLTPLSPLGNLYTVTADTPNTSILSATTVTVKGNDNEEPKVYPLSAASTCYLPISPFFAKKKYHSALYNNTDK